MLEGFSFQTGQKRPLETIDYCLFSMLFVASAAIGFYHAYRGRHKTTEFEFNFAGRSLHPIPVGMSISATFFSAVTILGVPAEVYTNNSMFLWTLVAYFIATIFVAHLFAPFFHGLKISSCYEYLEKRYNRVVRLLASSLFLTQYTIYLGIVLYLPCLALQGVTGVSLWYTMVIVCTVCTVYTMLGGMRSVVWLDTLQFCIIVTGLVIALFYGSKATGGIGNAWSIAASRGRIQFNETSFDPRKRHTVWNLTFGFSVFYIYVVGMVQTQVQRICTLNTKRKATLAVWISLPLFVVVQSLVCIVGIVMFAFYSDCDPVSYGLVTKNDQLIPFFVLDVTANVPGMPGLFLACVFSGSLSTISSCLNTLSTVVVEDFVKPFCCRKFASLHGVAITRLFVFIVGCVQFILAVSISQMSALIMQLTTSLQGMLVGPLMGVFLSGMFLPWTNSKGAATGLLVSFAFMVWIMAGVLIEKPTGKNPLTTSTSGCNMNITSHFDIDVKTLLSTNTSLTTLATTIITDEPVLHNFYKISYVWYSGLGTVVNIAVTLVVSLVTGLTKPSTLDCHLICPLFDRLFPWLPEKIRRPLRFGVIYDEKAVNEGNELGVHKMQSSSLLYSGE